MIINPNNPDGRVWLIQELLELAKIVKEHPQITVLSDEVYNRNIFDKTEFIPFASINGMFERTLSLYSFGKEFCCTGWRVGGATGPENIIMPMKEYIKSSTDGINLLSKLAVGHCLRLADDPYKGFGSFYEFIKFKFGSKKDRISNILKNNKKFDFEVVNPMGGYTLAVGIKRAINKVPMKYYYGNKGIPESEKRDFIEKFEDWKTLKDPLYTCDTAMHYYLATEHKIGVVPGNAFYYNADCENLGDLKG